MPLEILAIIVKELLASDDNVLGRSIPSPIAPLLYLAVFRPVARPILYQILELGGDITLPSGRIRRGCDILRLVHNSLQRCSMLAETETDAAALVKELKITNADSWGMVGNNGGSVEEEMNYHVQIIRLCPALTHIDLYYYCVHELQQQRLLSALSEQQSLRLLAVKVGCIPVFHHQDGLCDFSQLLRMLCRNWPALRSLSLTGYAIYSYDTDSPDAPIHVDSLTGRYPIMLEPLTLGYSNRRDHGYTFNDRDLNALLALHMQRLRTVKLVVLSNPRTMTSLQLCLDSWASNLEHLRISSGKFNSVYRVRDQHVNDECPFVVEGLQVARLTRLKELELVRLVIPLKDLRNLTQLKKLEVTIYEERMEDICDLLKQDCLPLLESIFVWILLDCKPGCEEIRKICSEKKIRFAYALMNTRY